MARRSSMRVAHDRCSTCNADSVPRRACTTRLSPSSIRTSVRRIATMSDRCSVRRARFAITASPMPRSKRLWNEAVNVAVSSEATREIRSQRSASDAVPRSRVRPRKSASFCAAARPMRVRGCHGATRATRIRTSRLRELMRLATGCYRHRCGSGLSDRRTRSLASRRALPGMSGRRSPTRACLRYEHASRRQDRHRHRRRVGLWTRASRRGTPRRAQPSSSTT